MLKTKPDNIIKVLLVDDEDRFRINTAAVLKRRGFGVITAESGYEAVEEIRNVDIDVVVLDISMPGMDGHETLRKLKKIQPDIEVIMLTGYGSLDSALEGWHEGVFAYLTKPCSIDFLMQRINEAYDKKTGQAGQVRRVKDIMEPLSVFMSTIREDQSVAEAIEAIHDLFDRTIAATKHRETLLRSMLVIDKCDRIIGVISMSDLLRGLQPSCLRLRDDRSSTDSIYLDTSDHLASFPIMVRMMASKKVRDLMPEKLPTIDVNADLIEATNRLLSLRVQSLLVMNGERPVGVIRDKDLFLEMTHIIKRNKVKNDCP